METFKSIDEINNLSDEARLWIFVFKKKLLTTQKKLVESKLLEFIQNWNSHGAKINGGFFIIYDQIVLLVAKEIPSGCSIDSSVKIFKEIYNQFDLNAIDKSLICFKNSYDQVLCYNRADFISRFKNHQVLLKDITILNTKISLVKDIKSNSLWQPLEKSWANHLLSF